MPSMVATIEYRSRQLSAEEVAAVWDQFPTAMREIAGDAIIVLMYGALSEIHPDLYVTLETLWKLASTRG